MARGGRGGGEYEHHVVAVRVRATGDGDLNMTLAGLDNVVEDVLEPIPLSATNTLEPTVLANIQNQRIRLEGGQDQLNDTFLIRRIVIYAKPVAAEHPGGGIL